MNPVVVGSIISFAAVVAGCSFEPVLVRSSPGAQSLSASSGPARAHARIESVRTTVNGAEQSTNPEFILRFQGMLERTNLFSDLRFGGRTRGATMVNLEVREHIDLHQQANNAKALIVAFSLLTLSPFLHERMDCRVDLVLNAVRPDGQSRQYTAFAETVGRWFGVINPAAPPRTIDAASGKALSAALASLMGQLTADEDFFAVRSEDAMGKPNEE
jgi:hypothetical protein